MTHTARPPFTRGRCIRALVVALALVAGVAAAAAPPRTPATGSRRYGLVFLVKGVRPPLAPQVAESLQTAHLANIGAMFRGGALEAAGPMGDDSRIAGLLVFRDAEPDLDSLLAPDPTVQLGRLKAEAHTWITRDGVGEAYRRKGVMDPGGRDSMVTFSFVLLRRGPKWTANETPGLARLLARQAKQIERWQQDGGLRMAGPIEGTGDLRGVYVFDADSAVTAARVARDPAVKAGRLVFEIHPWWTAYGVVPGP